MTVTWGVEEYATFRQMVKLKHLENKEEVKKEYDAIIKTDEDIEEIYKFDEDVVNSIRYQCAVFSLNFIKVPYMLAFDLAWIYF